MNYHIFFLTGVDNEIQIPKFVVVSALLTHLPIFFLSYTLESGQF